MSKYRKFTDYEKKTVYAKYNGHCAICGQPVKFKELTVDHMLPLSQGGTNDMGNLQLSCKECNLTKNRLTMEQFFDKIWELFMYNKKEIIKIQLHKAFGK